VISRLYREFDVIKQVRIGAAREGFAAKVVFLQPRSGLN
jgi:hypothetical protein